MNQKIRKEVFETNSSSTHSITINYGNGSSDIMVDINLPKEIVIHQDFFYNGEWKAWYNKLNFLYTYLLNYSPSDSQIITLFMDYIENFFSQHFPDIKIIWKGDETVGDCNALNHELIEDILQLVANSKALYWFLFKEESFITATPMGGTPTNEQPTDI